MNNSNIIFQAQESDGDKDHVREDVENTIQTPNNNNHLLNNDKEKEFTKETAPLTSPQIDIFDENEKKTLSNSSLILLGKYYNAEQEKIRDASLPAVKVGEVLGVVAYAYEKARNAVDYKGEHLLRRNAIERILKRQIWVNRGQESTLLAESLIRELVWARYIENDSVPKVKAKEIAQIIDKYHSLLVNGINLKVKVNKSEYWRDWLISVASSEIEEALVPSLFFIDAFTQAIVTWLNERYHWDESGIAEDEEQTQLIIAVERGFCGSDDARIRYHLLKSYIPSWNDFGDGDIKKNNQELFQITLGIEKSLSSPIQNKLYRFVKRTTASFEVVKKIIEIDPTKSKKLFLNKEVYENKVAEVSRDELKENRKRIRRGVTRSVIYIFITKIFLALLLEIPYELFIIKDVNPVSIGINLLLAPFLMLLFAPTAKEPKDTDIEKIVARVDAFTYRDDHVKKTPFSLAPAKRSAFMQIFFLAVYFTFFVLILLGITYLLMLLKFNIVSFLIFFMFLSLVLLFGYRIRYTTTDIRVHDENEGFFSHLTTIISLPFLKMGAFLSKSLSKINVLMVFLDFLIEAPLKNVIELFDEWSTFVKEKKQEVVEVPMN